MNVGLVHMLHDRGVFIVFGTDTGAEWHPGVWIRQTTGGQRPDSRNP